MADLSQLSDEQLGAYRDLLAAKQPDNRIAPVSAPKPPLPSGLTGPKAGEENSVGGSGNEPGLPAIVNQGIHQIGRSIPAFANSFARGASDLMEGAAKTASPLALAGAVAAPVATAGGIAGSYLGGKGGGALARAAHASPDTERAVSDVGSLAGGAAAGAPGFGKPGLRLAEGDIPTPGAFARAGSAIKTAAPDVSKGMAKFGAGATAVNAIPGEAGKLIVGYPLVRSGIRDIGSGFRSGMDEFRGPVQGPEGMPKKYTSPYQTFKYEPPQPPAGPRPAYQERPWKPPTPSNESAGIPATAGLPSNRVPGSLARASERPQEPDTVSRFAGPSSTAATNPMQLTPFQRITQLKSVNAQNPYEGPGRLRQTLGTQAEKMRQDRLAGAEPDKSRIVSPVDAANEAFRANQEARGLLKRAGDRQK